MNRWHRWHVVGLTTFLDLSNPLLMMLLPCNGGRPGLLGPEDSPPLPLSPERGGLPGPLATEEPLCLFLGKPAGIESSSWIHYSCHQYKLNDFLPSKKSTGLLENLVLVLGGLPRPRGAEGNSILPKFWNRNECWREPPDSKIFQCNIMNIKENTINSFMVAKGQFQGFLFHSWEIFYWKL